MKKFLFTFVIFGFLLSHSFGQASTLKCNLKLEKGSYFSDSMSYDGNTNGLSFIGFSAYHNDARPIDLEYRIYKSDQWSEWKKFDIQHEALDAGERIPYIGKLETVDFSAVQCRAKQELTSPLYVRLYKAKKSNEISISNTRGFNCDLPAICNRACWCEDCPVDSTPEFTEPTHLIVHHSAGQTESDDFAAVVRFYWDLHVGTNGWDDIGYNWLIDANGVIYEGRPDGYQGAHFSCINENTVGICMIGDFTSQVPQIDARTALIDLLAHEATEHDINVLERSYHETGDFVIENISGHRDGNESEYGCSTTSCPGDSFYPMLAQIREQVSELPCYNDIFSETEQVEGRPLIIYPNPTDDWITIYDDIEPSKNYTIYSLDGQQQITIIPSQKTDVSSLPSGVYFINSDSQLVGKFLKK